MSAFMVPSVEYLDASTAREYTCDDDCKRFLDESILGRRIHSMAFPRDHGSGDPQGGA